MTAFSTDAIVLHSTDYLESSQILRLMTREAGVQSVLARGARTSKKRFGTALDLFAEGKAEVQSKAGRELSTLVSFDVRTSRSSIAADLGRFVAAAAYAEAVLRVVHEEAAPRVFDTVHDTLDSIVYADHRIVSSDTVGGLWRLLAEVGVAPVLHNCAVCHRELDSNLDVSFSHHAGGALCQLCGSASTGARRLPSTARTAIAMWLAAGTVAVEDRVTVRAHQRLLREFLVHHAADQRPLRAYAVWESGSLEGVG